MASTSPLDDHLTCAVCFENYRRPHLLNCSHTYCLECIQGMKQKSVVTCPECRQQTNIKDIKKNFTLENLVESLSKLDLSVSRQSSLNAINIPDKCQVCRKSKKEVQWKCLSCETFMCLICKAGHPEAGHPMQSVEDIVNGQKARVKLEQSVSYLEAELGNFKRKNEILENEIEIIRESENSQLSEVDRNIDSMIDNLEQHRHKLKQVIKEEVNTVVHQVSANQQLYQSGIKQVQDKIMFISGLLEGTEQSYLADVAEGVVGKVRGEVNSIKAQLPQVCPHSFTL